MNKTHCVLALIISLIMFSYAQAEICEPYPPEGMKPGSTYKGIYVNGAYGYSIEIPKGYTGGLYQDPAAPQHGIQVILSWEPRSNIHFSGDANSLEDKETDKPLDAFGYCVFGLNTVREYAKDVKSFEMRKSKLGSFNAYQYTIRYTCPKSSLERIEETVIAIPKGRGLVYRVTLETTMNRFKEDHKVFQRIVSSWRMIEWK